MRTLVVDFADVSMGPLVASVLRRHLPRASVASAGFQPGGRRPPNKLRTALGTLGIDIEFHRSTMLSAGMVDWAELVVIHNESLRPKLAELGLNAALAPKLRPLGLFLQPVVTSLEDPSVFQLCSQPFQAALSRAVEAAENLGKLIASGAIKANMAEQKGAPE